MHLLPFGQQAFLATDLQGPKYINYQIRTGSEEFNLKSLRARREIFRPVIKFYRVSEKVSYLAAFLIGVNILLFLCLLCLLRINFPH